MKKINLKGVSEVLSEKELKNVMGGSGAMNCSAAGETCTSGSCIDSQSGRWGNCKVIMSSNGKPKCSCVINY